MSKEALKIQVEFQLIDKSLLIDQETLDEEFEGCYSTYIKWCLQDDGGGLSLFDLVDDFTTQKIVSIHKGDCERVDIGFFEQL